MTRMLLVFGLLVASGMYLVAETLVQPQLTIGLEAISPANPDTRMVYVDFILPPGMHQFRQDQFFKLELIDAAPTLLAGPTQYPPPTETIIGIPAWSGTVRLKLPVTGTRGPIWQVRAGWQICYDTGICLKPETKILSLAAPMADSAPAVGGSLLWYLLMAFIGGLILNLMPCVLPVLSLKALSLVRQSAGDTGSRIRHGVATFAGIIASLMALAGLIVALQAGGRLAGWGFQFQSPWYTMGLGLLVLGFALSLWGVWTISAPVIRSSTAFGVPPSPAKERLSGSFLNGVLTVVLATPCTAPFLGSALGFAFSAPPGIVFLVLGATGVGLALPMFLLSLIPGGLKFLPKPGVWMDRLSNIMGFALLATFVWLVSIVLRQINLDIFLQYLWFSLLWAFLLLVFGWVQRSGLRRTWRILVTVSLIGAALAGGYLLVGMPLTSGDRLKSDSARPTGVTRLPPPWIRFDEAAIAQDLAKGHPVLVDFTAEWCLTCKLNEAGPLSDSGVLESFKQAGAVLYRGDYTNGDPVIDTWLSRYHRAGVPFYLWLRSDGSHEVLPELLSTGKLLSLTAGTERSGITL